MTQATDLSPVKIIDGKSYMYDARGHLVPLAMVKPVDKLMDETVRNILHFGEELSAQISRFKGHTFDDIGAFQALIAQEYGASVGGKKGNITLTSFDGTCKVTVQVADCLDFGPELQAAKALVDECLNEWAAESRDEIRALVTRAFNVDREGKINRAEIFMLLRVSIEDERWVRAMDAVRDSIRIIGSKTYVRLHKRESADAAWQAVTIDLAAA